MTRLDYHTHASQLRGLSIANRDSASVSVINPNLYLRRAQSKADYIGPNPAGVSHSRAIYLLELYISLLYWSLSRDTLEPNVDVSAVIRRFRRDVAESKPSVSGKQHASPKLSSSRSDITNTTSMDQMKELMFSYMIPSRTFPVVKCLPFLFAVHSCTLSILSPRI